MTSEPSTPTGSDVSPELLEKYSRMFDQACQERHDMGEEKYGAGKFLTVNTLQEAAYELIDLANYARYGFIKLMLLNDYLESLEQDDSEEGSFQPVGQEWKK